MLKKPNKPNSFENVFVKNTNINRELRHQSALLENIFKANFKEFSRESYPLSFNITAVASKSALEIVGKKHEFPFSYYLSHIAILNQTNSLAGVAFEINGLLYPAEGFNVATTTSTPTKDLVFRANNSVASVYPINRYIDKPFNLQLYYINTHTSNQQIYLNFIGFIIPLKQALLTIQKKGAVRYE